MDISRLLDRLTWNEQAESTASWRLLMGFPGPTERTWNPTPSYSSSVWMGKNHLKFFNVAPCLGVLFPKRNVLLFTSQCYLKIKSYKWGLWSAGLELNTSPGNMDLNIQLSELRPYTYKRIRQCAKYSDLHIPWASCMTNTQIWYTNLACQSLFQVKIVFPEEKRLVQLDCMRAFPQDNQQRVECSTRA